MRVGLTRPAVVQILYPQPHVLPENPDIPGGFRSISFTPQAGENGRTFATTVPSIPQSVPASAIAVAPLPSFPVETNPEAK
jgi:hypothetical protein